MIATLLVLLAVFTGTALIADVIDPRIRAWRQRRADVRAAHTNARRWTS